MHASGVAAVGVTVPATPAQDQPRSRLPAPYAQVCPAKRLRRECASALPVPSLSGVTHGETASLKVDSVLSMAVRDLPARWNRALSLVASSLLVMFLGDDVVFSIWLPGSATPTIINS